MITISVSRANHRMHFLFQNNQIKRTNIRRKNKIKIKRKEKRKEKRKVCLRMYLICNIISQGTANAICGDAAVIIRVQEGEHQVQARILDVDAVVHDGGHVLVIGQVLSVAVRALHTNGVEQRPQIPLAQHMRLNNTRILQTTISSLNAEKMKQKYL
jgi:hypothetical protein